MAETSKVVNHPVNLMVEAVYLCCIGYDAVKVIKVFVELLLKVCGSIDLFGNPDMACCLQQHHLFLLLQLFLGFVRIERNHSCQHRVIALSMEHTPTNSPEGEGESQHDYDKERFIQHDSFRFSKQLWHILSIVCGPGVLFPHWYGQAFRRLHCSIHRSWCSSGWRDRVW